MFIAEYSDTSTVTSDEMSWGYVNMPDVVKLTLRVFPGQAGETDYEIEKPSDWQAWIYFKEGTIAGLKNAQKPYDSGEVIGYTDGVTEYLTFYNYLTDEIENRTAPHGRHVWHNANA